MPPFSLNNSAVTFKLASFGDHNLILSEMTVLLWCVASQPVTD